MSVFVFRDAKRQHVNGLTLGLGFHSETVSEIFMLQHVHYCFVKPKLRKTNLNSCCPFVVEPVGFVSVSLNELFAMADDQKATPFMGKKNCSQNTWDEIKMLKKMCNTRFVFTFLLLYFTLSLWWCNEQFW